MLPKPVRDVLNIRPGTELVIEVKGKEVTLRSQAQTAAITARIAALALPVGDWDRMEHEIEAGRRCPLASNELI